METINAPYAIESYYGDGSSSIEKIYAHPLGLELAELARELDEQRNSPSREALSINALAWDDDCWMPIMQTKHAVPFQRAVEARNNRRR